MAAEGRGRAAAQKALRMIRSGRRTAMQGGGRQQQMTLRSAWSAMAPVKEDGTDWTQQREDASTLSGRTQLLGLQEAWPDLAPPNRRAILDAILNALPMRRVQQIGHVETPQTLVSLRVALRQPLGSETGQEDNGDQGEQVEQSSSRRSREGPDSVRLRNRRDPERGESKAQGRLEILALL